MDEDRLVVAVDAAFRPHVRLAAVLLHERAARAQRGGFVEVAPQREEGDVRIVHLRGDDGEGLRLALGHLAAAPAVGVRQPLAQHDVVRAVDEDAQPRDRHAARQRRRPHVHGAVRLPHGKPDVGHADELPVPLPFVLVLFVVDAQQVDPVRDGAAVPPHVERGRLLLVQARGEADRPRNGIARQFRRILRVAATPVVTAIAVLLAGEELHDVARRHGTERVDEIRHVHRLDGHGAAAARRQVAPGGGKRDGGRPVARRPRAAELLRRHAPVRHRKPRMHDHLVGRARLEVAPQNAGVAPIHPVLRERPRLRLHLHVVHQRDKIGTVREFQIDFPLRCLEASHGGYGLLLRGFFRFRHRPLRRLGRLRRPGRLRNGIRGRPLPNTRSRRLGRGRCDLRLSVLGTVAASPRQNQGRQSGKPTETLHGNLLLHFAAALRSRMTLNMTDG